MSSTLAARLARRGREVKYPDRVPPNNEILRAWVVCGRTDINCQQRLCRWVLTFMLPGATGSTPGYSMIFSPGWKPIRDVMTLTKADARRPAVERTIPEFREYPVTHSVEPDYERYGSEPPTKFYGDRVTTWFGHVRAQCPTCGTENAIGRPAFRKHEPDLLLADEGDFLQWASRWLDKRHTV